MLYIRFFKIICLVLAVASCAARTTSGNYLGKYQEAVSRYEAKDYYEALRLFKEVMPMLKGKKEIILAQFYQAYAFFYQKSYKVSARCFEEFYKTYPRVAQAEKALYMQGYALYLSTPDVRLDQTQTEKAYKVVKSYKDKYPGGTYQKQVDEYSRILRAKLALKAFKSAELYYQLGHYQAAVLELERFQEEYGDSSYNEQALYLKINAQYRLAEESDPKEQLDKLLVVITFYHEFLDKYPTNKYAKELEKVYNIVLEKINKFVR